MNDYATLISRLRLGLRHVREPAAKAIEALLKENKVLRERLDQLLGTKK